MPEMCKIANRSAKLQLNRAKKLLLQRREQGNCLLTGHGKTWNDHMAISSLGRGKDSMPKTIN